MDTGTAVSVAAILVTLIGGFVTVGHRIGRVELKIETMWNWFVAQHDDGIIGGGKRSSDPQRFRKGVQ